MKEVVDLIKKKKELSGVQDNLVYDSLKKVVEKNKVDLNKVSEKELKIIVKAVRLDLRRKVGQFQYSIKKKNKFLKNQDFNKILETHSSTRERLLIYDGVRELLKTLEIKSILDLGCGINPVALATGIQEYHASDINDHDLEVVRKYFEKNKIKGKVFLYDLKSFNSEDFPKTDLVLLFKVLENIDDKKHILAEKIILGLKSNYVIVSFSTDTISGKKMNVPERRWIEKILENNNLSYEKMVFDNEIFYVIRKFDLKSS